MITLPGLFWVAICMADSTYVPPCSHILGTHIPFSSISPALMLSVSHSSCPPLLPAPLFCFIPVITLTTAVQDGDHQQSLALGPSTSCDALNPKQGICLPLAVFLSRCQGSFTKRIVLFLQMSPINKDEYDLPVEIWGLL